MTEKKATPNTKHPLLHEWTLFFDSSLANRGVTPVQNNNWGDDIKKLWDFNTVEDFWRLFNNVAAPHQIQVGCGYNLFKKGIEPKWEDETNKQGGRWTVGIPKPSHKGVIDTMWLNIAMAAIGETLEPEGKTNQVCGIVVNIRKKEDKISLWIRDSSDQETVLSIGKKFKEALEVAENVSVTFRKHFAENNADSHTL